MRIATHGKNLTSGPMCFHRIPRRAGLSLVEASISLAIGAALLVAVGAAYSASVSSIDNNDTFFRATQAARVSLNQIMTEVRRCQSVTVSSNQLDMTTYNGESRTYAWSNVTQYLTITRQVATPALTNNMAGNITALAFATDTQSVTMMITVKVGNSTVTFYGSAMPRRMVTYQ